MLMLQVILSVLFCYALECKRYLKYTLSPPVRTEWRPCELRPVIVEAETPCHPRRVQQHGIWLDHWHPRTNSGSVDGLVLLGLTVP